MINKVEYKNYSDAIDKLIHIAEIYNINVDDIANDMDKKRRKIVLENHPYSIFLGNDGRWKTHISDTNGKRKIIAKNTREKLEDYLCNFYISHSVEETLRSIYPEWIDYKRLHVVPTTITRIEKDWRKYYKDSEIIDKPLSELSPFEIDIWVHKSIKEYDMNKHQYGNFSLILRQMLDFAVAKNIIDVSPFNSVTVDKKRVLNKEHKKPDNTQVFLKNELNALKEVAWEDFYNKSNIKHQLVPLAVIFMFLTGLRVGEVSALKFDDIDVNSMLICRSVRYPDGEIINHTKGAFGDRTVPLVPEALELIKTATDRKLKENTKNEYVFSLLDDPINTYKAIQKAFTKYSRKIGIEPKSSHKARKTYVSTLIEGGVSPNTVSQIVGHMDVRTTLNNYFYDRSTDEEKYSQILNALS